MTKKISFDLIADVFRGIPSKEILEISNKEQQKLTSGKILPQKKKMNELVTSADILIQQILLNYFISSPLKNTYAIKSEELLQKINNKETKSWQLIIDPLDGTSAFCNGEKTWGVMAGLADSNGRLIYSWNLISTGDVYDSSTGFVPQKLPSWKEKIKSVGKIVINVYDYDAGAAENFQGNLEIISGGNIKKDQCRTTSLPAAIWAGWEIANRQLDGLLWLPSNEGKKNYPDYDLIFLGALKQRGWQIRLGKIGDSIEMVAVGPNPEDTNLLWQTGLKMILAEKANQLKRDQELEITSPLKND